MRDQELIRQLLADDLLSQPVGHIQKLAKRLGRNLIRKPSGELLKVALVSGFMSDFLVEILPLMFFRHGFSIDLYQGGYGEIASQLLVPDSDLHIFEPELVIILPTHRDLVYKIEFGTLQEKVETTLNDELLLWKNIWKSISVPIVQLSFDPPPLRPLGELDGFTIGGFTDYVRRVNRLFADTAPNHVSFIDAEYLAFRVGLSQWHDAHLYNMSKQPFSFDVLPIFAHAIAACSKGVLGGGKKVLIVDLDNTLWGGVVGDDGIGGIVLGSETSEGEAYTEFQRYIKDLSKRGVIVAVCSKNNESIARKVFNEHSGMVLTEHDIAHFEVNFEDKATNIRRIASALNIGLDACVFVDDNPVERSWVSEQLPEVLVVDMPREPEDYPLSLDQLNAFSVQRITEEDIGRSVSYQTRNKFSDVKRDEGAMELFLQRLESKVVIESVGDSSLDRIVQLIGKTNQFKLNHSVFTVDDIQSKSEEVVVVRLQDKSQDYGIVSVVVTSKIKKRMIIDNWVMSCRVFSRRLEYATQEVLIDKAIQLGCESISLDYQETDRNSLLGEILKDLGYTVGSSGSHVMHLADANQKIEHYMEIINTDT